MSMIKKLNILKFTEVWILQNQFFNYMNNILSLIYKVQAYHQKERKTGIFLSRNEMLALLYLAFSLDFSLCFSQPPSGRWLVVIKCLTQPQNTLTHKKKKNQIHVLGLIRTVSQIIIIQIYVLKIPIVIIVCRIFSVINHALLCDKSVVLLNCYLLFCYLSGCYSPSFTLAQNYLLKAQMLQSCQWPCSKTAKDTFSGFSLVSRPLLPLNWCILQTMTLFYLHFLCFPTGQSNGHPCKMPTS